MSKRNNHRHSENHHFNYNLIYVILIVAIICMFTVAFVFLFAINEIERYEENPGLLNVCNGKLIGNGDCEAIFVGFVYEDGACVKKSVSGCGAIIPFSSFEDCMDTCTVNK